MKLIHDLRPRCLAAARPMDPPVSLLGLCTLTGNWDDNPLTPVWCFKDSERYFTPFAIRRIL